MRKRKKRWQDMYEVQNQGNISRSSNFIVYSYVKVFVIPQTHTQMHTQGIFDTLKHNPGLEDNVQPEGVTV